jgi:hypothetical protein
MGLLGFSGRGFRSAANRGNPVVSWNAATRGDVGNLVLFAAMGESGVATCLHLGVPERSAWESR